MEVEVEEVEVVGEVEPVEGRVVLEDSRRPEEEEDDEEEVPETAFEDTELSLALTVLLLSMRDASKTPDTPRDRGVKAVIKPDSNAGTS